MSQINNCGDDDDDDERGRARFLSVGEAPSIGIQSTFDSTDVGPSAGK